MKKTHKLITAGTLYAAAIGGGIAANAERSPNTPAIIETNNTAPTNTSNTLGGIALTRPEAPEPPAGVKGQNGGDASGEPSILRPVLDGELSTVFDVNTTNTLLNAIGEAQVNIDPNYDPRTPEDEAVTGIDHGVTGPATPAQGIEGPALPLPNIDTRPPFHP